MNIIFMVKKKPFLTAHRDMLPYQGSREDPGKPQKLKGQITVCKNIQKESGTNISELNNQ